MARPSPELLRRIDAYFGAPRTTSRVGQIYLYDNPLLQEAARRRRT